MHFHTLLVFHTPHSSFFIQPVVTTLAGERERVMASYSDRLRIRLSPPKWKKYSLEQYIRHWHVNKVFYLLLSIPWSTPLNEINDWSMGDNLIAIGQLLNYYFENVTVGVSMEVRFIATASLPPEVFFSGASLWSLRPSSVEERRMKTSGTRVDFNKSDVGF